MNENQAEFKGWAKVEVMGHQSHIGYVTTEAYGQAVLFRIDRPEVAECEQTLEETEWVGDQRCPAGTIVKHGKLEAVSVLVGSGSIYRIIPCTEDTAMRAIRTSERRPLMVLKLPETQRLEAPATDLDPPDSDFDDDPYEDTDDEDVA